LSDLLDICYIFIVSCITHILNVSKNKLDIKRLLWDDWNVAHIARHDVVPNEVEEVCEGKHVERKGWRQRIFLIGTTKKDRILTVILEPTENTGEYRPITAYDASKRSIKTYEEEMKRGGDKAA